MKMNPRSVPALTTGISLTLALFAVIALYFFWQSANHSERTQLQLVRIDSAINLTNGVEWKVISDNKVDPQEAHELDSSLESIQRIFGEIDPHVGALPEITHIHDLSMKYVDALRLEISLMSARLFFFFFYFYILFFFLSFFFFFFYFFFVIYVFD